MMVLMICMMVLMIYQEMKMFIMKEIKQKQIENKKKTNRR